MSTDVTSSKLGGRAAWYVLFLIGASQAMSMVDRQILSILMPSIKADLKIGDAEMGLLYGTVFALFYAFFSLPLGRLADTWIRTKQLGWSILAWSAATAASGLANSYSVLAVSRLGVGIGEASVQPAGFSVLGDIFPKEKRGTISALMSASIAFGLGAAMWVGGAVADSWDAAYLATSAPFGLKGWQAAFIVASLPGFVIGALLLRVQEPQRGLADGIIHKEEAHPFREAWITLRSVTPGLVWLSFVRLKARLRDWLINLVGVFSLIVFAVLMTRWTDSVKALTAKGNSVAFTIGSVDITSNAMQWGMVAFGLYVVVSWLQGLRMRDRPAFSLIAGSTSMTLVIIVAALQMIINYAVMAWTPSYLINHFEQKASDVGLVFGFLVGGVGILGPLIAGPLSDWANKRFASGRIYVTLFSIVISTALAFGMFSAQSIRVFYFWFVAYSLILTMWAPSIYACLLDLVLPRMRGTVISYYILTMTIFGLGLGPYLVGLFSDINGGDLSAAILKVYWVSPIIITSLIILVKFFPKDIGAVVNRARNAGEVLD